MAKKTWIKVKRGILEPKHRRQLGQAWYLFFYMLDLTDWENGTIYDWKDGDVAADLDIPVATLRDHRRKLEAELYITTRIKQHGLEIKINNWTNPREYSGEVYNQVDGISSPSRNEVNTQVDTEVNTQVDTEVAEILTPLHLIHRTHITEHRSHEDSAEAPTYEPCDDDGLPIKPPKKKKTKDNPLGSHIAIREFRLLTGRYPPKINFQQVIDILGDKPDNLRMKNCYQAWCGKGYNQMNLSWLTDWYVNGIPQNGGQKKSVFAEVI